jgi:hypothetical protein
VRRAARLLRRKREGFSSLTSPPQNLWMSREDEKSLRKLLNKVKGQADTHAPSTAEAEALQKIVGSYKMKPADIAALVNWRHSHDF